MTENKAEREQPKKKADFEIEELKDGELDEVAGGSCYSCGGPCSECKGAANNI